MLKIQHLLKPCPVAYDDASHTYTLIKNGKLVPGVTSIIDNLNKPFLMPWAAKETAEAVKKARKELLAAETAEAFGLIVDDCKGAYRRKSKDALVSGSMAHDRCEQHIKAGMGLEAPIEGILEDSKAQASFEAFLSWEKGNRVEWLASEIVVGSEVHEYGGKFDALAIVNGLPTLIDFKTSSQISKDYFIQLAGYEIALDEMGLKVWQRLVLRIPKDGKDFEALVVPTPLDLDRETFLALRQIQRWQSYVNNKDNEVTDQMGKVKVPKIKVTTK